MRAGLPLYLEVLPRRQLFGERRVDLTLLVMGAIGIVRILPVEVLNHSSTDLSDIHVDLPIDSLVAFSETGQQLMSVLFLLDLVVDVVF